jgi:hypothetical protein
MADDDSVSEEEMVMVPPTMDSNSKAKFPQNVIKLHHYLMIGLAGDEVKQQQLMKKIDIDSAMYSAYQGFCEKYVNHECVETQEFMIDPPEGLTLEDLMIMDKRSKNKSKNHGLVTGECLWRKFQDTQTYLLNHANPLWDDSPNVSREENLLRVKQHLWELKEDGNFMDAHARQRQYVKKAFNPSWMPKEWLVFLVCGPPAGNKKKPSFSEKRAYIRPSMGSLLLDDQGDWDGDGSPRHKRMSFQAALPINGAFSALNHAAPRNLDMPLAEQMLKDVACRLQWYELETKRLEKLLDRAKDRGETEKAKRYQELLDIHLEQEIIPK